MANWCEGCLKVRGKKDDLKNFILNGLKPVDRFGVYQGDLEFDKYNCIYRKGKVRIRDTRKSFVESLNIYIDEDVESEQVICLDAIFAWGIITSELAEISKKYNIDFKIYAFEKGMEFNQDVEIHKGKIVVDKEIEFEDYEWECINPTLGG